MKSIAAKVMIGLGAVTAEADFATGLQPLEAETISDSFLQETKHPQVQAYNGGVNLDLRNTVDYTIPLYVGSEFIETHMLVDTASEWTVVMSENGRGNQLPSNYDPITSVTRKDVKQNPKDPESKELMMTVNLGAVIFSGPVKKEYMCV